MNQNMLLKEGQETLKKAKVEEAEIKAKKLLQFILKQTKEEFIINSLLEVSNLQKQEYQNKISQIIEGKPIQYITNKQEFMGLDFYVDENVLIPQPDTEILVEQAINYIKEGSLQKDNLQILDLCTGSGAIGISIVKYANSSLEKEKNKTEQKTNNVFVTATDISKNALEIAKKNAIRNEVIENMKFIKSDMFSNLEGNKFDIIVSNPPYIETDIIKTLSKEVQNEPKIALDGGEDGLKFYKIILREAENYLNEGGYLLLEIGYDQGDKVLNLWKQLKEKSKCELNIVTKRPIKDLAGNERVHIFKKG